MNYSQSEIMRKQKEITSVSNKMKYRMGEWIAYGGILCVITLLLIIVFGLSGAVRGMIDSTPKLEEADILISGHASILYDSTGKKMQTLSADNTAQDYVPIDEIPKYVRQAVVAIEDKRFEEHHGVDMLELLSFIYYSATGEGDPLQDSGETITQQLVRNQLLEGTGGMNFMEKFRAAVREQQLAIQLEDNFGKDKIIEYYLNTINLGQNVTGVQAAAKRYFDKNIAEVNISEAAVLAAAMSDSAEYNPITKQDRNAQRRKAVLKNMLDGQYISEDDYEEALGDDVYLRIQNVNNKKANGRGDTNSYFADAVAEQVIQDLKDHLGYSQTKAYNLLYHGGLRIYTCQEPSLQKICDEVINSDRYYPTTVHSSLVYRLVVEKNGKKLEYSEADIKSYFLGKEGENVSLDIDKISTARSYVRGFRQDMMKDGGKILEESIQLVKQPQASFVLIEQSTGKVKAIVGGRGKKTVNREINRATELKRQPGLALTMLSTYVPALDTAGVTLGSIQDDAAYNAVGFESESGKYSSVGFDGFITVREAIKNSKSISAVKTMQDMSVQTGYSFLKKFGFTTLVERKENDDGNIYSDLQPQLALGELNEGVTNLEMTAAYAAVANGGVYHKPRFYTRIVDKDGNVLLGNNTSGNRIIKKHTAWLLTDAMADAVQNGNGKTTKFSDIETAQAGNGASAAGATDFWFEGYTPYYTAGIWSGADENTSQEQSDYYMVIWREIMERVHKQAKRTEGDFEKPEDIVKRTICSKCGNRAVRGLCDEAEGGDTACEEYFAMGTEPEENCTCHVKYAFCKESGKLANEECLEKEIEYRVLLQKQEASKTADTKYTVSYNLSGEYCDVHVK